MSFSTVLTHAHHYRASRPLYRLGSWVPERCDGFNRSIRFTSLLEIGNRHGLLYSHWRSIFGTLEPEPVGARIWITDPTSRNIRHALSPAQVYRDRHWILYQSFQGPIP